MSPKGGNRKGAGRKSNLTRKGPRLLYITDQDFNYLKKIGINNASRGLRVVLASNRQLSADQRPRYAIMTTGRKGRPVIVGEKFLEYQDAQESLLAHQYQKYGEYWLTIVER